MSTQKFTNRQYEAEIESVFEAFFGRPLTALKTHVSHTDSIVYEGTAGDKTAIFKMIDPAGVDVDIVVQEAWAYERASEKGLPTPQVFIVDDSCSKLPAPFILVEKARGIDLRTADMKPEVRDPFLIKIGQAVKVMHTIPVEGYGRLIVDPNGQVRGQYDDWKTAALSAVEPGLAKLAGNPDFNNDLLDLARTVVADHEQILDTLEAGKLLHGDLGLVHFYGDLEAGDLTGIIDFGECKSGDPVWDFVDFRWSYVRTILKGYGILDTDEACQDFERKFYYYALLRDLVWTVRFNEKWPKDAAERMEFVIDAVAKHFGYLKRQP